MSRPDLNLLVTLDVVLTEGSVARAAEKLRLSPSAMSRALGRLRSATGDPLLVRAGRRLVPTPRAMELRERVGRLVHEAEAVLSPTDKLNLKGLDRAFSIRASEGFVESFGPALIARVGKDAPRARLHFQQKAAHENTSLRDGAADVEIGILRDAAAPEFRVQALFRDRFVGVVRPRHPLSKGRVSAAAYLKSRHVAVSLSGLLQSPLDKALAREKMEREVVTVVSGFTAAIALARGSDLVAAAPERQTAALRAGMHTFALPFRVPELTISMLWHPRLDADQGHQWLRGCIRQVCSEVNS